MKKLVFFMAVVFVTMSSFTLEEFTDCDAIAEDLYYSTLRGGYSQEDATHAYMYSFETCTHDDEGDSVYTVNLE